MLPAPPPPPPPPDALGADLCKALALLRRQPQIADFVLRPPDLKHDLQMLTLSRPSFILSTTEEQRGAVNGTIAMYYLGVPLFSERAGFSGGLVVTTYTARTHPLHAPAVMADVRVGRYVRHNATGEWCIITRNERDKVTRLQYIRVTKNVARERICLTCSSDIFDAGHIRESVLFQCHDDEYRFCNNCCVTPPRICTCLSAPAAPAPPPLTPHPALTGLARAVWRVMSEGAAQWHGKVRVTVVNKMVPSAAAHFDACMDVVSSYNPTIDTLLADQMKRLAIIEKASASICVPAPITPPPLPSTHALPTTTTTTTTSTTETTDSTDTDIPVTTASALFSSVPPPVIPKPHPLDHSHLPFFEPGHFEVAQHFLVPPQLPISEPLVEEPMLPADPSTLPAGLHMCMQPFDLDDDWCSYIASDHDTRSVSSTLSTAGSDTAPLPDSVPCVDDIMQPIDPHPQLLASYPSSICALPPSKRKQPQHLQSFEKCAPLAPQPAVKPKPLAPRPAGMSVTDGFIWQIGAFAGNQAALAARLDAIEKERKAEERRKKNRQAAARSNARKKDIMDGIRAEIREQKNKEMQLREKRARLQSENEMLRKRIHAAR